VGKAIRALVVKVVFSEWERMLELVRQRLREMEVGYAWHTGSVAQRRRRAEIQMFKGDAQCRVFLSTDSGGVGLNLQAASVVVIVLYRGILLSLNNESLEPGAKTRLEQ
jgi:SNF2 family DNA or RNA helicase